MFEGKWILNIKLDINYLSSILIQNGILCFRFEMKGYNKKKILNIKFDWKYCYYVKAGMLRLISEHFL